MALFAPKIALAEIHISRLPEWMWWGMEGEPADFKESAGFGIGDGTQIEFCMYPITTAPDAQSDQQYVRDACVFVKPSQPKRADDRYFSLMAEKLSRFLSFVTDQHLQTTMISGYTDDVRTSNRSRWPNPTILYERGTRVEDPILRYMVPAPRYWNVQDQLMDLVQRWFEMYEEWSYPVQLYFIACVEKRLGALEPNVVLSVMALEALHRTQGLQGDGSRSRLEALARPFAHHFGSEEALANAIEQVRILRNDCVHGGSEVVEEGLGKDLVTSLCFAEALFKLHVMRRLDLDIAEAIKRETTLAIRLRQAQQPTRGEDLAHRVAKDLAKARGTHRK